MSGMPCGNEADIRIVHLQAKKWQRLPTNHQKQGETHETDPHAQPSEGATPTIALILDF